MSGEALTKKPDIRLATTTAMFTSSDEAIEQRYPFSSGNTVDQSEEKSSTGGTSIDSIEPPNIRLAHGPGAQGDNVLTGRNGVKPMEEGSLPGLLVSYYYLDQFKQNRHRYHYRDWVMDSGAFSAHNSGKTIDLHEYIECCLELMETDPSLSEIYALDVIGDWRASLKNTEEMWKYGVPAIPCFHANEPWDVLICLARDYPKIALGGVALAKAKKKMAWAGQCFSRVWPKKIHGFAFCSEQAVLGLPFHCMTDEHKVLTKRGWLGRTEIREGDLALAFNDGTARWESVQKVFSYQVNEAPVVMMDNRTISARTTSNHRWRVWDLKRQQWKWSTTAALGVHDRIPRAAEYQPPTKASYENWLVSLFAWYWTEGYVKQRKGYKLPSITISQSSAANPTKVVLIRQTLKAAGAMFSETVSRRLYKPNGRDIRSDVLVTFEITGHIRDKLLAISPDKHIPLDFIYKLTKEQLKLFINTSVMGDGNKIRRVTTHGGFAIYQKDGKNIDEFRVACLLAGYATSYWESRCGAGAQTVSNGFIRPKHYGHKRQDIRIEEVKHTGYVWCIQVPSGAFFTKCNQHIYVTGNSVDATSWEIGPCGFGTWRAFGGQRVSVRGSKQNLRVEVEWYLDLERRARQRWKKEMALLEEIAPTIRLALAGTGSDTYLKEGGAVHKGLAPRTEQSPPDVRLAVMSNQGGANDLNARALKDPTVRLVAANDAGAGGARVIARALGEEANDPGQQLIKKPKVAPKGKAKHTAPDPYAPTIRLAEGGTGGRIEAKAAALRSSNSTE